MLKFFKKLQLILPPVLTNFLLKNMGYLGMAPWQYMPEGFDYKVKSNGWDLDSIAKLQAKKWPDYVKRIQSNDTIGINHESSITDGTDPFFHNLLMSFAYVLSLAGLDKKQVNFLDWGGGIGHYGLLAEELLKPSGIPLNYFCYDFKIFGEHGKKLNPSYTYFDDKQQHQDVHFDLLMASSSIWYEEKWQNGVDQLCAYQSDYLYITRMIFISEKPSFVAIQRPKNMGYDTEYLFWIINKHEFVGYLSEKGFNLIREFEFGPTTPIFKAPEQGTMKGFLFKKQSS